MKLEWMGIAGGITAFVGIWFGHVGVRKIEAAARSLALPTLAALLLGAALEAGALLSRSLYLSAVLGILGMTVLWDALEFSRQYRRVMKGHAPANPQNPRHAALLAKGGSATAVDWLDRQPGDFSSPKIISGRLE